MSANAESRLLLVTGLSGAGKSTVLKVLEDLGWEVVDNLPLALLETLIDAPVKPGEAGRPLAIGIDSRSRGFRPALLVRRIKELRESGRRDIQTLFLDCAGASCSSASRILIGADASNADSKSAGSGWPATVST